MNRLAQLASIGDASAIAPAVDELVSLLEQGRYELARVRMDALRIRLVDLRDGMSATDVGDPDLESIRAHIVFTADSEEASPDASMVIRPRLCWATRATD